MTLKTACDAALQETGNIGLPSSYIGNTNPTAVRTRRLATRTGRILALDYDWEILRKQHTFNTAAGTATYALPDDYDRFENGTFWDNANDRPLLGPTSQRDWAWYQSGIGSPVGINKAFRLSGGQIEIYPTPSAVEELTFQYYSNEWVTLAAGGTGEDFEEDDDTTVFDEDLLILGIKWRVLAEDGFLGPTHDIVMQSYQYKEYENRLNSLLLKDGGAAEIIYAERNRYPGNIPDTGFGL